MTNNNNWQQKLDHFSVEKNKKYPHEKRKRNDK